MIRQLSTYLLLGLACLLLISEANSEQTVGESVFTRGQISEDLYLAGGRVDVFAEVEGDVTCAGGRITIDGQVAGDVNVVGGSLTLLGSIQDDLRLAGGDVVINAAVGDGALAAGGNLLVSPEASIGGDAILGGGRVEVAGQVRGDLLAAGGEVVISGQVNGDLELAARSIKIKPGAVIQGNLTYRSPGPADIDPQAVIKGSVSHIDTPMPETADITGGLAVIGVLVWISIALTGLVLYLLFPQTSLSSARAAAAAPWKAAGLGLAIFSATPVLGTILFASLFGWLLAWLLMTSYGVLLLLGFFTGVLMLSDAIKRRIRPGREGSRLGNSFAFVLTLLLTTLFGMIPLLGWLLIFLLLWQGTGGIALQLYNGRRDDTAGQMAL